MAKTQVVLCKPPPSRKRAGKCVVPNSGIRGTKACDRVQYIILDKEFKFILKSESVLDDSCILTEKGTEIYLSVIHNLVIVPEIKCTHDISSSDDSDDSECSTERPDCDNENDYTSPSTTIVVPATLMGHVIDKGEDLSTTLKLRPILT